MKLVKGDTMQRQLWNSTLSLILSNKTTVKYKTCPSIVVSKCPVIDSSVTDPQKVEWAIKKNAKEKRG